MLGGAARYTSAHIIHGYRIGREIARSGKNLLTGATNGVPYAAAIGAKDIGGFVVGISPAGSMEEHVERYKRPLDFTDVIIYTGMGLEGRNSINVRSAKGAIFVAGEFGTLNEFSAAWTIGNNVLGILDGVGGISTYIRDIIANVQSTYGSTVVFDHDPIQLVHRVCGLVDEKHSAQTLYWQFEEIGGDVKHIVTEYLKTEAATP